MDTRSAFGAITESGAAEAATPTQTLAIVAALDREIAPFVKGWEQTIGQWDGRNFRVYRKQNAVVVCGGVGAEAARRAAEAVINLHHPSLIISAGFAGALDPKMAVGDTLTPRQVIDAGDGSRVHTEDGDGVLITFDTVADVEQKARFAKAFEAHAIDMEAAAVGKAAEAHGIKFLACKVISDSSDTSLPALNKFIGPNGKFHVGRYVMHIAVRPWRWAAMMRLARDSAKAARALSVSLEEHRQKAVGF